LSIGSNQERNRSCVAPFISKEVNYHLICVFFLESGMTTLKLDVMLFDGVTPRFPKRRNINNHNNNNDQSSTSTEHYIYFSKFI